MPSSSAPVIVWFRDDLRVGDNPALVHATEAGRPIIALYVLDLISEFPRPLGTATRWWLHGSLESLRTSLLRVGIPLVLRCGPTIDVVRDLAEETGAEAVAWNRRYDPAAVALDNEVANAMHDLGVKVVTCAANLLFEPSDVTTKAGGSFRVFTPFWRAALQRGAPRVPLPLPSDRSNPLKVSGDELSEWTLRPAQSEWAHKLSRVWQPGEQGALERLSEFVDRRLNGYARARDRPDREGTSRLSPHLRFGEISPFQIWHAVRNRQGEDADRFRMELGWREFNHHIAFHHQDLHERNVQPRFDAFPWRENESSLQEWQEGRTGYPIVDAGMRQLRETGWMHNRVRMIAASFLVKHLLVDWREGERWFWNRLVDADPANNPANWQWAAGSGADAAPFFRIFNPIRQGELFDPEGSYVRRFVPELAGLPAPQIHSPWTVGEQRLKDAGVTLGKTYPHPVVDHKAAREMALDALKDLRNSSE
ncbi:deoxyribodipyrimidine photo-lyase [Agaricicola taiwanensis]|uniref:Deoxyribodipyrimidine photo-lyase n=1 Tax=Agaricicola taiwanensis TaxID=591372 RepID=A0A8J2YIJ5_9RHOB|nr:deoxyribodipyrimidine photo-lyase [Agaricicola taiwanensis]GGE45224.1 deoxyribodipyrimidine photo-lyase [Agaricicola taiwanensis]